MLVKEFIAQTVCLSKSAVKEFIAQTVCLSKSAGQKSLPLKQTIYCSKNPPIKECWSRRFAAQIVRRSKKPLRKQSPPVKKSAAQRQLAFLRVRRSRTADFLRVRQSKCPSVKVFGAQTLRRSVDRSRSPPETISVGHCMVP